MMSVVLSSSLNALEEVIAMKGVQVQRGSFEELPGTDMGMLYMQIRPELYPIIAAKGSIRVLSDTHPWEKDIYSNPVAIADWLASTLYF
jgi:hypothetical protein